MGNGWIEDGLNNFNYIDSEWFGLRVSNFVSGDLYLIGIFIGGIRFGWFSDKYEEFNREIMDCGGFYINGDKI